MDRIQVEYYCAMTPLNQLASITVPEARVLLISPFDKSSLKDIEHAINASDLGINPANDGSVIRFVIPALTEETRKALLKTLKKSVKMLKLLSVTFVVMLWTKLKNKKKLKKSLKTN